MDNETEQASDELTKSTRMDRSVSTYAHSRRHWVRSLFPNLRDAAIRWSEDDAGSLAASVAYYLALSLFPMLLLLTSGIGLFLKFTRLGQDAQEKLLSTVASHGSQVIEAQVEQVLTQLKNQSVVGGPFGVIMAIIAAIGVFAQLDRGFDRVWRVAPKRGQTLRGTILGVLHHRVFAFFMLLCLGGMLVGLFIANMVFSQVRSVASDTVPSLDHLFNLSHFAFVVVANALLFTLVYKWLPKKPVGWSEAFRGGLLAALIWEFGRFVLGAFLIGMRYTSAYGVIGSFIAILLWCYYGMSIVFFGAEYVQVLQSRKSKAQDAKPHTSNAHVSSIVVQDPSESDTLRSYRIRPFRSETENCSSNAIVSAEEPEATLRPSPGEVATVPRIRPRMRND